MGKFKARVIFPSHEKSMMIYTSHFGNTSFQYITVTREGVRKSYLVEPTIDSGELSYKVVRPLTFSEVNYINPWLRLYR